MNRNLKNIDKLEKILKSKKIRKILIITGENIIYKHDIYNFFSTIIKKFNTLIIIKKSSLPNFKEYTGIKKKFLQFRPQFIISFGGGAVIDYSKILSVFGYGGNFNSKKLNKKKIPTLIIPTTAGSGSESTSFAVLYKGKYKQSISHKLLLPDYFLLIPKLILTCNDNIKFSSAFDVIAQSIESIFSKKADTKSKMYSLKSIKIWNKEIYNFIKKTTLQNAKQMLLASNYAGKAINIAKTNAPHAFSYPYSILFGIPHGNAVSINFLKIIKFFYFHRNKKINLNFDKVFNILKVKNYIEFEKKIKKIKKLMKLNSQIKLLNKKNINKVLPLINVERLSNSPIDFNKKTIKEILLYANE